MTEASLCSWLAIPASSELYKVVFPSAHTPAHLALAAAASLALTAGLLRRSFFWATFGVAVSPLALAHLALVPAIIAALPAALNRLLPFFAGWAAVASVPLILAHLACWAAAILARTAADLRCFFGSSTEDGDEISTPPPAMESIWPWRASICSLMVMMRWSWRVVKFVRFVIGD